MVDRSCDATHINAFPDLYRDLRFIPLGVNEPLVLAPGQIRRYKLCCSSQPRRHRRTRGLVLRRLGCRACCVPESQPRRSSTKWLPRPRRHRRRAWEAFERILKRHGYFTTGLQKIEAAQAVATHIAVDQNRSRSFAHFRDAIAEASA